MRQFAPGDRLLIRATATDVTAAQLSRGKNAWLRVGPGDVVEAGEPGPYVTIPYTNWRGEFGLRQIAPIRLYWGSNEWHPEPQWLIEAWDPQKVSVRTFALSGIGTAAALARPAHAPRVPEEIVRLSEATESHAWGEFRFKEAATKWVRSLIANQPAAPVVANEGAE